MSTYFKLFEHWNNSIKLEEIEIENIPSLAKDFILLVSRPLSTGTKPEPEQLLEPDQTITKPEPVYTDREVA